ncbi:MAG: copper chaperone PCu(A)C [Gammaproteobacteria bacterium]|nr:MAG: copper chaperone PCu(A)C [Gammaproteobacteria bacterium]
MKKAWALIFVMTSLALAGLVGSAQHPPLLQASEAWIKQLPPVIRVRAGYVIIQNQDSRPHRLVGASSPAFERIQMHRTLIDGGRMKMVRAEHFSIPAKGTLTLAPGGRHLMMFSPRRPLPAGSEVPVTLRFADGSELTVPFRVRP